MDSKLSNPETFKELSKDPSFFQQYEKKQIELKNLERNWEEISLKLDNLKD